jgi:triacylglycerol lipase
MFMRYLIPVLLLCFSAVSCNEEGQKKGGPGNSFEESVKQKPPFTDSTAAVFAEISYCPDPQAQLDKYLPGWKLIWNPQAIGGNYAFVATDGDKYVLAIRGSLLSFTEDAFNNWIYHDLNVAVQDSWPYCSAGKAKISQGSYIGWQNIGKMKDRVSGKPLWDFLSENVADEKPLILTGHSLGGNLAIVYASYIWAKFNETGKPKKNINVITFAAPAAGNKSFAADFDQKFPAAIRIENSNDIVAKFPCTDKLKNLGALFINGPSASAIDIGYEKINTKLSAAFTVISTGLDLLEFTTSFSGYSHTSGNGKQINIALSGKNNGNTASAWFAEAGFQHSMERYAAALGAPVIKCE